MSDIKQEALKVGSGYRAVKTNAGVIELSSRSRAFINGADRQSWLQGQITNDARLLQPGRALRFFFCSPTGQIISDARALDLGDRYLMDAPTEAMPALLERLNGLIIMEEVELEEAGERYFQLSVQGVKVGDVLESVFETASLPKEQDQFERVSWRGAEFWVVNIDRTGNGGYDLIGASQHLSDLLKASQAAGAERLSDLDLESLRVEAGIPIFGKELTERVLPPEAGKRVEEQMISYTKGCYTGQEVLMRLHSRGHTNRILRGLKLEGDSVPEPGDALVSAEHPSPGVITSAVFSPKLNAPLALAYLRHELSSPGTALQVKHQDQLLEAVVVELPV